MMQKIEVLTAEADDKPGCSATLARQLNLELAHWRVQHPHATVLQTDTRAYCNEYRHVATLTITYQEPTEGESS